MITKLKKKKNKKRKEKGLVDIRSSFGVGPQKTPFPTTNLPHGGGLKLHLQLEQFVGLNWTAGEVSTLWKLANVIAHLNLQTASTWLSSIVQTFDHWKKTKKNINHWKNNFNSWKKSIKISMIKKKQLKKKVLFFVFFFNHCHQFFVLFFLSRTERKVEKSVWEWVLRCFFKEKKKNLFLFSLFYHQINL